MRIQNRNQNQNQKILKKILENHRKKTTKKVLRGIAKFQKNHLKIKKIQKIPINLIIHITQKFVKNPMSRKNLRKIQKISRNLNKILEDPKFQSTSTKIMKILIPKKKTRKIPKSMKFKKKSNSQKFQKTLKNVRKKSLRTKKTKLVFASLLLRFPMKNQNLILQLMGSHARQLRKK